jgi:acyl carrier protein phosphodiesterase
MNFLAHLYLSGSDEEVLIGNFIGDYVKGKEYLYYPEKIRKGILLHRYIDSFTDQHPVTKLSRNRLTSKYNKYSGIVIDIFYDYILASQWSSHYPDPLDQFVADVYSILKKHYFTLPQGIKNWFPNFLRNNWLTTYSKIEGIEIVLQRMSSRTSLPAYTEFAIEVLREQEDELRHEFNDFFPVLTEYVRKEHGINPGEPLNFKG